jgi:hypothetical protein
MIDSTTGCTGLESIFGTLSLQSFDRLFAILIASGWLEADTLVWYTWIADFQRHAAEHNHLDSVSVCSQVI